MWVLGFILQPNLCSSYIYIVHQDDNAAYKQFGNAVTV